MTESEMTMVERAARALCVEVRIDPDRRYNGRPLWEQHANLARALIQAMREPTPRMIAAAAETPGMKTVVQAWRAMVDAALAEDEA